MSCLTEISRAKYIVKNIQQCILKPNFGHADLKCQYFVNLNIAACKNVHGMVLREFKLLGLILNNKTYEKAKV